MSDVKTELTLFNRTLTLHRFPERSNEALQAWDAGDEYLINYVEEMDLPDGQRILILNDNFGALSCWFSDRHIVHMMSDSFISHKGVLKNLQRNQCNKVEYLTATDRIPADIDLVLMQIPKNNRFLSWQLSQLNAQLSECCAIVAVNKVKEIHTSTLNLFERFLGKTNTSLAWKKHRLVFSHPDKNISERAEPFTEWPVENSIRLKNLPNVYSGESLDMGARFMLEHIPEDPKLKHILDLGCGNGVLSVKAAQLNPQAKITCVDESFMATESARMNLQSNLDSKQEYHCITNNCLDDFIQQDIDLVLCNPPFHQQYAITDHIAWQMFCDTKHVLNKDGKLLVIGNRHLGYDVKLKRLFGKLQVNVVASNQKFVILQATK